MKLVCDLLQVVKSFVFACSKNAEISNSTEPICLPLSCFLRRSQSPRILSFQFISLSSPNSHSPGIAAHLHRIPHTHFPEVPIFLNSKFPLSRILNLHGTSEAQNSLNYESYVADVDVHVLCRDSLRSLAATIACFE